MVKTYEKGDTIEPTELDMFDAPEYGIHETRPHKSYSYPKGTKTHYQKIVVYGDEALRDKILKLLQENPDG